MSGNIATIVLVKSTNSGVGGTAGDGTVTVGLTDGSTSQISTGQSDGNSGGVVSIGKVETGGIISSQGYGSLVVARSSNTAIVTTEKDGSFAHGRADGTSPSSSTMPSQISANGEGAQAFGKALTGGVVGSIADASLSFGEATVGGAVQAEATGASAHGNAVSGGIIASGLGSEASGSVTTASSQVLASGEASKAFGQCGNGYNVQATNVGSMAFGVAENASISATAQSSMAGGFPLAGPVAANGVASIAYGDDNTGNARLSTTLGLGNTNNSYASIMGGQYGLNYSTTATPGSWVGTDPLLALGNGTSSTPNNAFEINKDGRVIETASKLNHAIRVVSGAVTLNARTDRTVLFDTSTSTGTASLPLGEHGLEMFILDGKNQANTRNILIASAGTDTFQNGLSTDTINIDGGLRHYQFLSGVWYILSYR